MATTLSEAVRTHDNRGNREKASFSRRMLVAGLDPMILGACQGEAQTGASLGAEMAAEGGMLGEAVWSVADVVPPGPWPRWRWLSIAGRSRCAMPSGVLAGTRRIV